MVRCWPKAAFQKSGMLLILELHDKAPHSILPRGILPGDYYAVDYTKNYCFGRVLTASKSFVTFKFLHKVGTGTFDWPERDDTDSSHISCIFFGPVNLRYNTCRPIF